MSAGLHLAVSHLWDRKAPVARCKAGDSSHLCIVYYTDFFCNRINEEYHCDSDNTAKNYVNSSILRTF